MAYGLKYKSTLYPVGKAPIDVKIYKDGYSGAVTTLLIAKEGAILNIDVNDYFVSLHSTSIELKIVNNLSNFFELDDLFSISDFEFKVTLSDTTYTYFEGFIPCDIVEQQFLPKGIVTLNATNNLKRLTEFYPTIFTVKGPYKLIDIISHCLSFTGLTLPIQINCSLHETSNTLSNNTLFDHTWIFSDLFLQDDITYSTCDVILSTILDSFQCFVYYWNGIWYIERWKDIMNNEGIPQMKSYIRYAITTNAISVVSELFSVVQIGNSENKIRFIETSQVVDYTPGLKQVKVTLKEKIKINLTNYYYNNIVTAYGYSSILDHMAGGATTISLIAASEAATMANITLWNWPDVYIWHIDYHLTSTISTNYNRIVNALLYTNTYQPYNYQTWPAITDFLLYGGDPVRQYYSVLSSLFGISTRLNFDGNTSMVGNTDEHTPTNLTVSFKIKLPADFLSVFPIDKLHPEKYTFFARFYLKMEDSTGDWYITKNETTGKYQVVQRNSIIFSAGTTIDPAIITIPIPFSSFTNKTEYYHEFSTTISINDLAIGVGFFNFVLGICELGYHNEDTFPGAEIPQHALKSTIIGDIIVSVNNDVQDNIIVGGINQGFITINEKEMSLYDIINHNILNGLFTDPTMQVFTVSWEDIQHLTALPLPKKKIEDMYQIYHKPRHQLTSNCFYKSVLKPFSIVFESNYNSYFYLSGFQWIIDSNKYNAVTFKEYIADDDIT